MPWRATAAMLALAALLTAGCTRAVAPQPAERALILISIDGFRHDYLDRFAAPHLSALAAEGFRADGLRPIFPSKTFPNHYSIVTGLYADRHGIVGNSMWDPEIPGRFSLSRQEAVTDGRWWGGEPIWVTAERQGVRSATYFWPGSEAEIAGYRPSYWKRFDSSAPGGRRIVQVLAWLELPPEERPRLITLYFGAVDHEGHEHGPLAPQVAEAIASVDRQVGRLVDGLRQRSLLASTDLLVVSDHGMADVGPDRLVVLAEHLDIKRLRISELNPVATLEATDGDQDAVVRRLQDVPHVHVYRREETPAAWHYRDHRRIPPIIVVADEGWSIATIAPDAERRRTFPRGMHGYPPEVKTMHGLLIGRGPSLARHLRVGTVDNVDLYELMCRLLGIEAAPNDGRLDRVQRLLADG